MNYNLLDWSNRCLLCFNHVHFPIFRSPIRWVCCPLLHPFQDYWRVFDCLFSRKACFCTFNCLNIFDGEICLAEFRPEFKKWAERAWGIRSQFGPRMLTNKASNICWTGPTYNWICAKLRLYKLKLDSIWVKSILSSSSNLSSLLESCLNSVCLRKIKLEFCSSLNKV